MKSEDIIENVNYLNIIVLNQNNFTKCRKYQKNTDNSQFYISELLVHPWSNLLNIYNQEEIWLITLLIFNRSGVCKCGM